MTVVDVYAYQSYTGGRFVRLSIDADRRTVTLTRIEAEALARDIATALAELDDELSPSARGELRTGDAAEDEYQP